MSRGWQGDHPETVVINLPSRQDRLARIRGELAKIGIAEFGVQPGVLRADGNRTMGVATAHLEVLSAAARDGKDSILVIEDDCVVVRDATSILALVIAQLACVAWDVVYFGIKPVKGVPLERASDNLFRASSCVLTHAVWYRSTVFRYLLEADVLSDLARSPGLKWDQWCARNLQSRFRCLVVDPAMCLQAPGYSDIVERQVDYSAADAHSLRVCESLVEVADGCD